MTASILPVTGAEAYDLIFEEHLAKLPALDQETMQRAMTNSSRVWLGCDDGRIIAVWGLIPPTMLSDRAYLWLYTTANLTEHTFLFIRNSQRAVQEMLEHYPVIVGHGLVGNTRSLRWLRWLGAQFGEPVGKFIPFEIRAEQWPQALGQSA